MADNPRRAAPESKAKQPPNAIILDGPKITRLLRGSECVAEFEGNRLILSDAFALEFEGLQGDLAVIDDGLPPKEAREASKCFSKAYENLLAIAKEELTPPGPKKGPDRFGAL